MLNIIPFHKPFITEEEVEEVVDSIRSGWWTMGPKTKKFENEFGKYIGSKNSVSANSWTASAHLALEALGLQEGDEVIVPSITFTATAEVVCYFKAVPKIVEVEERTFNISPNAIEKAITSKTKAIIPVHYGGQPCDMDEISFIAKKHHLKIVEDAAHALPSTYKGRKIGTISDVTCFSFYATKTLATGEGGMICTEDDDIAKRCSIMRLHGMSRDAWNRYTSEGSWYYEVIAPGYKYNMTDIQASLGIAQLKKIEKLYGMRIAIAEKYNEAFSKCEFVSIPFLKSDRETSWHLYALTLHLDKLKISRSEFINLMKERGIICSVHFIPLYKHPFYRDTFQLNKKDFPISEKMYSGQVSLPIWPGMTEKQIVYVASSVQTICEENKR